jgi:uncharacterized SAM-dependent methyltransferase
MSSLTTKMSKSPEGKNMEQLICTARNIRLHIPVQDKDADRAPLEAEIEAVLTVMDRTIEFVGSGLINMEKTKTIRFVMNVKAARKFSESLLAWSDEAEKNTAEINDALGLLPLEDEKP